MHDDFDDATESVAVLVSLSDLLLHRRGCRFVEAANGIGIDGVGICRSRNTRRWRLHGSDAHNVAEDLHACYLAQHGSGHCSEGNSGGCFSGAGTFEDGAGVVEAVLLHSHQVCVPWPWSRQGCVACQVGDLLRRHRIGRHDLLPLRPLGVADLNGNGSTEGLSMPHAAEDSHGVGLEFHACATARAESTPGEVMPDVATGHLNMRRDSLHDRREGLPVRFTRR